MRVVLLTKELADRIDKKLLDELCRHKLTGNISSMLSIIRNKAKGLATKNDVLVGIRGSQILAIGFGAAGTKVYEIKYLCAKPVGKLTKQFKTTGRGTKLLKALESKAKERGLNRVILEPLDENVAEFYIHNGYNWTGRPHVYVEKTLN